MYNDNPPSFVLSHIDHIISLEGGYVDNTDDSGGETNYGITKRVADNFSCYWEDHQWDGNMKTMPLSFAKQVYLEEYYYRPKFDLFEGVSDILLKELVDTGINCGTGTAIKFIQRLLNSFNNKGETYPDLVVDGLLGSKTINAYRTLRDKRGEITTEKVVYNCLNALQTVKYVELTELREKDETFVWGWITNRIDYLPF